MKPAEFTAEIQRTERWKMSPEDVAELFMQLDDSEMARFFSELENIEWKAWETPFVFQLQAVIDSECLQWGGKNKMEQIGNYGNDA